MERKVIIMSRISVILLMIVLSMWAIVTQGNSLITYLILAILVLTGVASYKKSGQSLDERDVYIQLAASYGSYITTLCFILVMQAIEYFKMGTANKAYGYIMAILMISNLVFTAWFRRQSK